jgi:3-oxoacyl-[acyl-carrier-protein] synthase II
MTPIAITGLGAVSAYGLGVDALMDGLCAGVSAIGVGPSWGGRGPAAMIPGKPTTSIEIAILAADQATQGLDTGIGLAVVGASTSSDMVIGEEAFRQVLFEEPLAKPDDYLWAQLAARPAEHVHRRLGATGPRISLSTACTSGTCAVGIAADLLQTGRAKRALAFGADVICRISYFGFHSLGVYSQAPCKPFDRSRDGMNIGEGAAALLLEPLADALARGAKPLALLRGYGNTSDAHHLTTPHPEGAGARRAIQGALGDLPAERIDHINAHATATRLNDQVEASVLACLPGASVTALKGAVGHTLGAAGALEAVVTILAMQQERIPPIIGCQDPEYDLDLILETREARIEHALSANFAFGGHNAVLRLQRWAP